MVARPAHPVPCLIRRVPPVYSPFVIPFLHIGHFTIPTFGLMVALAMLSAYWLLRADIGRHNLSTRADAETFIAIPCLAGIAGAKLYHVLESPAEFLAHPVALLFSQFGFAWFGGLIAGFAAFLWLGWRRNIPLLQLLDIGSPAAALGYGVGRIGCLLSGDGDYGIPTSLPWGMSFPHGLVPTDQRVHPTPIYEFIAACLIASLLWRFGRGECAHHIASTGVSVRSCGSVFAYYLMLSGAARFLVEFIRINPRSLLGLTNAQWASALSVASGLALWTWLRTPPSGSG